MLLCLQGTVIAKPMTDHLHKNMSLKWILIKITLTPKDNKKRCFFFLSTVNLFDRLSSHDLKGHEICAYPKFRLVQQVDTNRSTLNLVQQAAAGH